MSILKTHRHKTNIAIVALTSLYVIGTAVALSTPYWVSSTLLLAPIAVFAATPLGISVLALYVIGTAVALSTPYWVSSTLLLAPIAVFAATPLGISVLAFAAVALASLAIYFIIKNNEISEPKIPSIVIKSCEGDLFVKVKDEDFEYIKKHNQNKNQDGIVIPDEYLIYFSLESKSYYITATSKEMDNNNGLLKINSLGRKNDKGEYELIHEHGKKLETLGLGSEENDAKELTIRIVPSSIVKSPEAEQQKNERSLSN